MPMPKQREITSVWLKKDTNIPHMFNCYTCQCPQFRYQGYVIMLIESEAPMAWPFELYCKNKSCTRIFRIDFIY